MGVRDVSRVGELALSHIQDAVGKGQLFWKVLGFYISISIYLYISIYTYTHTHSHFVELAGLKITEICLSRLLKLSLFIIKLSDKLFASQEDKFFSCCLIQTKKQHSVGKTSSFLHSTKMFQVFYLKKEHKVIGFCLYSNTSFYY